ncbi:hypothetical protein KAI87_05890, partial [Myxococcota bacterium]|nr:hypothetical protein [Myxococcota bacterium]
MLALASDIPTDITVPIVPPTIGLGDTSALIGYTNQFIINADGNREFTIDRLSRTNLPFVFLAIVSKSGAISQPAIVQNNEWIATLNGKRPGSSMPNPLGVQVTHSFAEDSAVQISVEPDDSDDSDDSNDLSSTHLPDGAALIAKQKSEWKYHTLETSPLPLSRDQHSMVFLPESETILLYGGTGCAQPNPCYTPDCVQADSWVYADGIKTWLWDIKTNRWQDESVPGATNPGPRNKAAMVYDSLHNRVFLYGGGDETDNNNLWQWNIDEKSWSKISILANQDGETVLPNPRSEA